MKIIKGLTKHISAPFENCINFQSGKADIRIELKAKGFGWIWLASLIWYSLTFNAIPAVCFWSLSITFLLSFFWARQNSSFLVGTRELKYSAFQVGDMLEEEISLFNNYWLPVLWAKFDDQSSIPGYTIRSIRAVSGFETLHFSSTAICEQRGVYSLGPWQLHLSDPLGLFLAIQTYHEIKEVIVFPPLAPLPDHLLAHHQTRGEHRRLRHVIEADTINASTTRPFVPGDTLNRVHWATSARRQQLYIKTFEPETSSRVWLIPDLEASVQLGRGKDSTLETTAILLASLSNQLLRDNLAVGIFARDANTHIALPQKNKAHLWSILRIIAQLQVVDDQPFAQTIRESKPLIRNNDLIVLITPSLEFEWSKEIIRGSKLRGVDVLLYDPASFGAKTNALAVTEWLAHQGIACRLVRQAEIRPISGSYGALRRWEFTVLGTGRVIVRQSPRLAKPTSILNKYNPHP
jgi:uncharacterized protein (DUF58 family)